MDSLDEAGVCAKVGGVVDFVFKEDAGDVVSCEADGVDDAVVGGCEEKVRVD